MLFLLAFSFKKNNNNEGTNYVVSLSQTKVDDTCKTTKLDNTDSGCEVCDSPYTDCSKAENWIPGFMSASTHVEEYARNYAEELKKELRKKGYHSCSVWPSAVDYIGWPEDKGTQDRALRYHFFRYRYDTDTIQH